MKTKHDGRDWSEYPVGTKAFAIMGGHWEKVDYGPGKQNGWKWCTGAVFTTPGGDTNGMVELPADPNATYNAKVREVAESITRIIHVTAYNDRNKSIPDSNYWHIKVAGYEDVARAMVADMADVFVQGMAYAYPCAVPINTDDELKRRGLIPNTKTDNNA